MHVLYDDLMIEINRWLKWGLQFAAVFFLLCLIVGCSGEEQAAVSGQTVVTSSGTLEPEVTAPKVAIPSTISSLAPSKITQVWANDGGDKVTRDELRATNDPFSVGNLVWTGSQISLFGARNEVVAFNMVLEAPEQEASNVTVTLDRLDGPEGASIDTKTVSSDNLFNYVERNIELFYVRYLEIKGLSTEIFFQGYTHDERHIPVRCRRPYTDMGEGSGGWEDRTCHNKFYPDIAVPLILAKPFTIPAGTNQSIWGDIYIPKDVPAGNYFGQISIFEDDTLTWQIPIKLEVFDFELPDLPSARTMLFYSRENINDRYLSEHNAYPAPGTDVYSQAQMIADRHFQLAHRHKISLIDGYTPVDRMDANWSGRLTGELFAPAQGYSGVGTGVGNNVYAVGVYGGWPWQKGNRDEMWANTDAWVDWFEAHSFETPTEYFLYLVDESQDYTQIERWAEWMNENPGSGQRLMSMATIDLSAAVTYAPSLDIPTIGVGSSATVQEDIAATYITNPAHRLFFYHGTRPATGSFAVEDEGVALWALAWAQYKMGINRWFYWESTYYDNFQGNTGQTNVFQRAQTFGSLSECCDMTLGETGISYLNGDGVLFYPGTDIRYPKDSYDVQGPFASLRLKQWRRGIQDVDYLTLAAAIEPDRTAQIVSDMIPRVLWEDDPGNPPGMFGDISWSINPDVWDTARMELARIIEGAS